MAIFSINLQAKAGPFEIKLDLDKDLANERTILGLFLGGKYGELDVTQPLIKVLNPGDFVVDVGANVGLYSLLMAGLVGPEGKVLSFEPGKNNLPRLQRNVELSGFHNISIVAKPVSDSLKEVTFFLNADDSGGNALWDPALCEHNPKSRETPAPQLMKTTTLDQEILALGRGTPRLIKIDTEGAELRVLQGAAEMLRDCKVPFIIAEYNEFGLEKMNASSRELRAFMESLGYSMFAQYENGALPKLIPLETTFETPYIPNVLFSTPGNVAEIWKYEYFNPAPSQTAQKPKTT